MAKTVFVLRDGTGFVYVTYSMYDVVRRIEDGVRCGEVARVEIMVKEDRHDTRVTRSG